MIPGNHDYHDSAETEHGLEMFKDIPCITVMDKPTIKDKLLFLPYMKDHEKIKEIVECPEAKEVVAIFGHLDVIGAKMNNSRLSTHGCSKDIFTKPTYSGHYHSPSTYGNVRYIGSPYQVHLGESEDKKALCVVNFKTGKLHETIPINIGRRHYKVTIAEDLEKYKKGDRVIAEFGSDHVDKLRERGKEAASCHLKWNCQWY